MHEQTRRGPKGSQRTEQQRQKKKKEKKENHKKEKKNEDPHMPRRNVKDETEGRGEQEKKKNSKEGVTYYQMCFSWNILVRLLRQLLRDQRAHCFKNRGLSSSVVSTSASG